MYTNAQPANSAQNHNITFVEQLLPVCPFMEHTRPKHSSTTLLTLRKLIAEGEVKISAHGYDELVEYELQAQSLITHIDDAILIEDYPLFPKGPCVLVLQLDVDHQPVHVVWGIPKGHEGPAVLIDAYRPDDTRWDEGFTRRKR